MPSSSSSFFPGTITVCAVAQVVLSKVSVAGERVTSVESLSVTAKVTLASGCVLSLTVRVALSPFSPEVLSVPVTVSPAVSSSVKVAVTLSGTKALYLASAELIGESRILVVGLVGWSMKLLMPRTVTVCEVFQFTELKSR